MTELTYHDGHYHRSREDDAYSHHSRHSNRSNRSVRSNEQSGSLWRRTYDAWDKVLYGIGSAYYKICGR